MLIFAYRLDMFGCLGALERGSFGRVCAGGDEVWIGGNV